MFSPCRFWNKWMMNKIDEFEILDFLRESDRRKIHTGEYNGKMKLRRISIG